MSNAVRVIESLYQYKRKANYAIDDACSKLARDLFYKLCDNKFYEGFTGNTQRSYSAASFCDGQLAFFIQGKDVWTASEVRFKVEKGKKVRLKSPYEGPPRTVTGTVDVDDYYGYETARQYIMSQPTLQSGWTIIVGVGTEYYTFIRGRNLSASDEVNYLFNQDNMLKSFINNIKFNLKS